ncbi:hypothetical protein BDB00DRAFT_510582 [Zychaea mexicana]|uniref:uncharacterized protein n=1 Tax=Zychaea mexicana TaxID=64656 RepID=UPI0022FDD95A|nr:uncharacterized protein BDB00DRAFT_510582 [Zychaea mexicana]KAI9491174.1 hypothetical protein BDB00DRAFT_510582 [Zychaea mexicana]
MSRSPTTESQRSVASYPVTPTPGKLRIQIHNCYLNIPVKRPYIIITMGEQAFETSVSEYPQGRWHESFEFTVSFHAQLFNTIQMDLYDSYMLLPDKHVGRAEIRLRNLRGMPHTFTNYYEVWDKQLSTGASSRVGRVKTMASNVGAVQAMISYIYQEADGIAAAATTTPTTDHQQKNGSSSTSSDMATRENLRSIKNNTMKSNGASDDQLADEFRRHVKQQREAKAISFRKYEENNNDDKESNKPLLDDGLDFPDESETEDDADGSDLGLAQLRIHNSNLKSKKEQEQEGSKSKTSTITTSRNTAPASPTKQGSSSSSWFSLTRRATHKRSSSSSINSSASYSRLESHEPDPPPSKDNAELANTVNVLADDEGSLKPFPLLSAIGSWTTNKETNQVLRAILKLLAAFGQGFELSNIQILTGFSVLEKFYANLPRDRTWDVIEDLSEIELPAYFWKFSVASYGWKGLNFFGKGNGYFSDAMRDHSDALSIIEHLSIPKEDLLAYEFRMASAFRPSYYIALDRPTNSIVLCIRGTMSAFDAMTDLVCEYEQWKGGLVHKGMKSAATWFFRHVAPQLVAYCNEHSTNALYIVGHSLGAATASILTIMLVDFIDEFKGAHCDEFTLKCFGYAPACGLSLDISERYQDYIQSIVFANDVVSKLSYGSMMDVKELVLASAEAARNLGFSQLLWTDKTEGKEWEDAFTRIGEARRRCLESLENPRDPAPRDDTRIVIERTDPKRVSSEIIIRRSIILDHLPTNFDLAFRRAREALMLQDTASSHRPSSESGVLESTEQENPAEAEALKHTTTKHEGA